MKREKIIEKMKAERIKRNWSILEQSKAMGLPCSTLWRAYRKGIGSIKTLEFLESYYSPKK